MSTGIRFDLQISQGATFSQDITYLNSGVSGFAGIKFRYSDSGTFSNFNLSFSATGFNLSMPATGTAAIPAYRYLWDTEFTDSNLLVSKPFGGYCEVFPQVY